MDWSALSPDFDPIEQEWDALGICIVVQLHLPGDIKQLKQMPDVEWTLLLQELLDNLVLSIKIWAASRYAASLSVLGRTAPTHLSCPEDARPIILYSPTRSDRKHRQRASFSLSLARSVLASRFSFPPLLSSRINPFKLQGWVNYTPLVISHWQASKVCTTLHLSLSSIPMVQTEQWLWLLSNAPVTKACQNIWSMICLVYSFILK
ncbi:hypothetical protein TNCV_4354131 [Trichonephila clavipes]|nr:hypothetical protein TNCV_4354131 [Trichonephila clavipes]